MLQFRPIAATVLALAHVSPVSASITDPPTATPALAPEDSTIVVQGTRQSAKQIRDYVRALTTASSFGQIGRFYAAACPIAIGLPPPQNQAIAARLRAVSMAADIPLAPIGCNPNIFVIVAPDRQEAIRSLNRSFPAYFSGMSRSDTVALAETSGPATAWHVSTKLSADGELLKKVGGTGYYILENSNTPSRLRAATIPAFVASVVVIDLQSAAGLTVTQLADYAAMRVFADTTPSKAAGVAAPSILTILDKAPDQLVPVTLTNWDLAFLKALYTTSNAHYAGYQRSDMARIVSKELKKAAPQDRR